MIEKEIETKKTRRRDARRKRREAHHRDLEQPVRLATRARVPGRDTSYAESTGFESLPRAYPEALVESRVMGTHETLAHARKRLGWS